MAAGKRRTVPPEWEPRSRVFAEAVCSYHLARGLDPASPPIATSIRINSELVPQRGDTLLRLLAKAGFPMEGARVLDAGCGYGALAAYLALRGRPARLVATDVREDFIALGHACAEWADLPSSLEFVHADARERSVWPERSFDIVLATGLLLRLSPADVHAVLEEHFRVLDDGGCLLVYQANGWSIRNLGRRRDDDGLPASPPELRRQFRQTGFEKMRTTGFARDRRLPWPLREFGSYVAVSGVRPPDGPA